MRFTLPVASIVALLSLLAASCGSGSSSGTTGGGGNTPSEPAWYCFDYGPSCGCTYHGSPILAGGDIEKVDACTPSGPDGKTLLCTAADSSHCDCEPYACVAFVAFPDECRCDREYALIKDGTEQDVATCTGKRCCLKKDGAACSCSPTPSCDDDTWIVPSCEPAAVQEMLGKKQQAGAVAACPPEGKAEICTSCGEFLEVFLDDSYADPAPLCGRRHSEREELHRGSAQIFDNLLGCICSNCGDLCFAACGGSNDQPGCDECMTGALADDCAGWAASCKDDDAL